MRSKFCNEVELNDTKIKVKLQVGNDIKQYDVYKVVYVKDGTIVETIAAKVDGEWLLFDTTHLSEYGITGENNPEESPVTGDNAQTTLWVFLMILSLMAAAGVFVLIRNKKTAAENNDEK